MTGLTQEELTNLPASITDAATSPYPHQSWHSVSEVALNVREGACAACQGCPPGGCPYLYDLGDNPHQDA